MRLRPAAIAAGLAAIEKERADLQARARGNPGASGTRARRLLSRLPEIVSEYRKLVRNGIKSLAKRWRRPAKPPELLIDGQIVLKPTLDRTQVAGDVRFLDLGGARASACAAAPILRGKTSAGGRSWTYLLRIPR
jgi:hypothetical protein